MPCVMLLTRQGFVNVLICAGEHLMPRSIFDGKQNHGTNISELGHDEFHILFCIITVNQLDMYSLIHRFRFANKSPTTVENVDLYSDGQASVSEGSLKYVSEKGGNDSPVSYQEASGAPVEVNSPLGYSVGGLTVIFLNLSKMIGTGVFSTPSSVLNGTGSVGLALIYWLIGLIISIAGFSVYLEFAACFPNRSGSEAVYLEQAYPRPRYFFPVAFAVQTVVLSFSSGNSIVMAEYLYAIGGYSPSNWETKGVAIGCYTLAFLLVVFHTKTSYFASNAIGVVKLVTLIFISITGLVVLGHNTKVKDPNMNFRNAFDGHTTPYGAANAMIKIIFSYAGYENAFNVVNEVKNPVKKIRNNGLAALVIVGILYMLANVAYFAAVPKDELTKSKQIAAALFFEHVFGSSGAVRGLNFLIALSSFGNLVAVLLGTSRLIRECGRQGVLPFTKFFVSTKPFGTPLGPYLTKWLLTIILILALPAGDAFSFISDVQVYTASIFYLLMGIGIYLVRIRRRRMNLPQPTFRAWQICVILNILVQLYVLILSWYPPAGGADAGDVNFYYATYIVTGYGIVALCAIYYTLWIRIIPSWRGYRIRQELVDLGNGDKNHRLVKVSVSELQQWDAIHDAVGRRITGSSAGTEDHSSLGKDSL